MFFTKMKKMISICLFIYHHRIWYKYTEDKKKTNNKGLLIHINAVYSLRMDFQLNNVVELNEAFALHALINGGFH